MVALHVENIAEMKVSLYLQHICLYIRWQEEPSYIQRMHQGVDMAITKIPRQGTGREPRTVCVLGKKFGLYLVRNGEGF